MKFDIDPCYILDCSYNFTLVNLIRYRECKKTSLTSLCGTRYTVYGVDIFLFPLFVIRSGEKINIAKCPEVEETAI